MNNITNVCQKETSQEPSKMLENKIEKDNEYSTTRILNQNENVKENTTKRKKRGKYKNWSNYEEQWLINNYPIHGRNYCMKYLNCSLHVLKPKLKKLKIKFTGILPQDLNNKICTICKNEKPKSEFYSRGDKLRCACKKCTVDLPKYNLNVRLRTACRQRVISALKNNTKINKTFNLIGCSPNQLKEHLKKQFKVGMSWENYGKVWQIDHIIPCCQFNLSDKNEQRKCFHYTNVRPLWKTTEIAKKFNDFNTIGNLNRNKFI